MSSGARWLSMTPRMCQRFLFFSSVRTSSLPTPIFLPMRPIRGMLVLMATGVSTSATAERSSSSKLGIWPCVMETFRWHMARTSCRAGVSATERHSRPAGMLRSGVALRPAAAALEQGGVSLLVMGVQRGVAVSCLAEIRLRGVFWLPSFRPVEPDGVVSVTRNTSSTLQGLWQTERHLPPGWVCPTWRPSSSDWEPPSRSVESLCCRWRRERRFPSDRCSVSAPRPEEESSSSWKEPSCSLDESWDLSWAREPKPLSSDKDLLA